MAKYKLKVPLIAQKKSNSCWRAALKMVKQYHGVEYDETGARDLYTANEGVRPDQLAALAQQADMFRPTIRLSFSVPSLIDVMQRLGPIWAAGYWWNYPHVIVVTGVKGDGDGGKVYFNDPEYGGHRNKQSLGWFNENMVVGGLMFHDA